MLLGSVTIPTLSNLHVAFTNVKLFLFLSGLRECVLSLRDTSQLYRADGQCAPCLCYATNRSARRSLRMPRSLRYLGSLDLHWTQSYRCGERVYGDRIVCVRPPFGTMFRGGYCNSTVLYTDGVQLHRDVAES